MGRLDLQAIPRAQRHPALARLPRGEPAARRTERGLRGSRRRDAVPDDRRGQPQRVPHPRRARARRGHEREAQGGRGRSRRHRDARRLPELHGHGRGTGSRRGRRVPADRPAAVRSELPAPAAVRCRPSGDERRHVLAAPRRLRGGRVRPGAALRPCIGQHGAAGRHHVAHDELPHRLAGALQPDRGHRRDDRGVG